MYVYHNNFRKSNKINVYKTTFFGQNWIAFFAAKRQPHSLYNNIWFCFVREYHYRNAIGQNDQFRLRTIFAYICFAFALKQACIFTCVCKTCILPSSDSPISLHMYARIIYMCVCVCNMHACLLMYIAYLFNSFICCVKRKWMWWNGLNFTFSHFCSRKEVYYIKILFRKENSKCEWPPSPLSARLYQSSISTSFNDIITKWLLLFVISFISIKRCSIKKEKSGKRRVIFDL